MHSRSPSKRRRFTGAVVLTLGLTSVVAGSAAAAPSDTVLEVCDDCEYETIQSAIDAAADGTEIQVAAGEYNEALKIDKSIRLIGASAGVSPNQQGNPLETNPDFASGSIIAPPAGKKNHALNISGAGGESIAIEGFTVDLAAGADEQLYLRNSSASDVSLDLKNNLFKNAPEPNEGWIWFNGKLGNFEINAQGNRFQDGAVSNGFRIYNSSEEAKATLNLQDNVFIDNAGWSLNNSSSGTTTGEITGNWFGNSSAKADPNVDEFGVRQSGMVIAGDYEGMVIKKNVLKDLEAVGFNLWETISGDVEISNNLIDGHSNQDGGAVIRVYKPANSNPGDVSGVVVKNNRFENLVGNSTAIANQEGAGQIDARLNWWDAASPKFDNLISGDVLHEPWFTSSAMDGTSDEGITVTDENPAVVIETSDSPVTINTSDSVEKPTLDAAALLDEEGIATLPQITVVDASGIELEIADGTKIHAPGGDWDGQIELPRELAASEVDPANDEMHVEFAMTVGADETLLFDKPVKLTLPEQAGKDAAFVDSGEFAAIDAKCTAEDIESGLAAVDECAVNDGEDLAIWTKHFTVFLTYTEATSADDSKNDEEAADAVTKQPSFTG